MTKTRLEAFSDGVIAIIITIMVLELKIPHEPSLHALAPLLPVFLSYIMSFIYIGIYWGNHHHLLHTVYHVNSKIIWSNLHLLFWLSMVPFATAWMGENNFDSSPVALYAMVMIGCAVAYTLLQRAIMSGNSQPSAMAKALEKQKVKGYLSLSGYMISVLVAFFFPILSALIFVIIAVMWIIPDRNIEKAMKDTSEFGPHS